MGKKKVIVEQYEATKKENGKIKCLCRNHSSSANNRFELVLATLSV